MGKTFGYTRKAGKDWFRSDEYGDKEIESLKDPEGGIEVYLPTAIPSPFARFDLVKTAFSNIAKSKNLKKEVAGNGDVIASRTDEKLVSDCLDLAELLFNRDSIPGGLEILPWQRSRELGLLKDSTPEHRRLAETLELYLDQDADAYNFGNLDTLYIFKYEHKVIGCTSPATLFVTSGNDLSSAKIRLTTNDVTFDDSYTPLYERDKEFQRYFHSIFIANPELRTRMKVVYEYLQSNLKYLEQYDRDLYSQLMELTEENYSSSYSELTLTGPGHPVTVSGVTLRTRKRSDIETALGASDFCIAATIPLNGPAPLVLQNDLTRPLKYASDRWDQATTVPYVDKDGLESRRLPGIRTKYPYLTVSDFLEPYLIRLVYPLHSEKFFDGNVTATGEEVKKGYLLPLKRQFFDYFTTADLLTRLPDKPQITISNGLGESAKVVLRIPIQKSDELITFERIYYPAPEDQTPPTDEVNNKGVIVEHQFGITIFPFVKPQNNDASFYRIQLIDRNVSDNLKDTSYDIKFYSNGLTDSVKPQAVKSRSNKAQEGANSKYYALDKPFDFIQVSTSGSAMSGVIIPKWPLSTRGSKQFSFAIDFGTTNTHVEYKEDSGQPKPFDIGLTDLQIATLFHPDKTTDDFAGSSAIAIRELIEDEFVPHVIGNESQFRFPQRTVISESPTLDIKTQTWALADFNIPFVYERKRLFAKIHSNLKWGDRGHDNEIRVKRFLENLVMLLRNKVLLNEGNLETTKIIWFYPSSMTPWRKGQLEGAWKELCEQYFGQSVAPIGIPESIAPFYYFKGSTRIQGGIHKPVVSIDIGGGTTDVVVFKDGPLLLTSFKFAANALFGDGFSKNGAASSNGLISKYYPQFKQLLENNNIPDAVAALTSIKENNRSEDINAFFFSLENHARINDPSLFSYNSLLANDTDIKILFVYFYSAIIFHIANLMKHEGIDLPKHLVFSGTGSKVLSIIAPDHDALATLSRNIFEKVFERTFDSDGMTVEMEKNFPKEVTCKGGLMSNPEDLRINPHEIKRILTCLEDEGVVGLTEADLTDARKQKIVDYIVKFNSLFIDLNKEVNFANNFGVSPNSLRTFSKEINKHLRDFLEDGLKFSHDSEGAGDDQAFGETLFFYPIIGSINYLLNKLTA
ncbi:MAG: hypothetical protein HS105_05475 [Chloracidobacterium sp.]|nr:hypothetical protein [Chloracidobacterium sp.]